VGGIPEEVNHLGTSDTPSGILTPMGDASAMAAGLVRLLKDDDLRASLGENAARDARNRFALTRHIDTHLDWYSEIIAREKS
jgi:glycosyltransferase involved in cell wall biosynthesis